MIRPLTAFIVDDEPPAREGLRLRLEREPGITVTGEYASAAAAAASLRTDPPDLLFLDVEMPREDGFELLERSGAGDLPLVVFVTAHERHAVRAFRVHAFDYLLKPVEQERLHDTLQRARRHLATTENSHLADRVRGVLGLPAPSPPPQAPARSGVPGRTIPVRHEGSMRFIEAERIDYVVAAGDTVRVHVGASAHVVNRTMREMLRLLDPERFVRIHRSTIINVGRVVEVQPYFHGEYIVVLQGGAKLKVSRGRRAAVWERLGLGPAT